MTQPDQILAHKLAGFVFDQITYTGREIPADSTVSKITASKLADDWDFMSQFRRYFVPGRIPDPVWQELIDVLAKIPANKLEPYHLSHFQGGLVLMPSSDKLESFGLLHNAQVCYAKTARDPAHDTALVYFLRVLNQTLRKLEHQNSQSEGCYGSVICDDCGAHPAQRDNNMLLPPWPVSDGSACAPWPIKQSYYNRSGRSLRHSTTIQA
jgi:hypothetical protein